MNARLSDLTLSAVPSTLGKPTLEKYEPLIGAGAVDRIKCKSARLRGAHIVHISSTFYGGGVTEILTPLTLLLNSLGIQTGWRMIQGTPSRAAMAREPLFFLVAFDRVFVMQN